MNELQTEIEKAEKAFEDGDFDLLREILPPLVKVNVPAAIRISCSFFEPGIPDDECDRIYVDGMFRAADLGDKKAKYRVGVFYDLGEYGIAQDKVRASNIFKELAENGDPHCMWIYACELIWGNGSFPKSTQEGLRLLEQSASDGSSAACMTIARFYNDGLFGYRKDFYNRDRYRELALKYDESCYDPYS